MIAIFAGWAATASALGFPVVIPPSILVVISILTSLDVIVIVPPDLIIGSPFVVGPFVYFDEFGVDPSESGSVILVSKDISSVRVGVVALPPLIDDEGLFQAGCLILLFQILVESWTALRNVIHLSMESGSSVATQERIIIDILLDEVWALGISFIVGHDHVRIKINLVVRCLLLLFRVVVRIEDD